VAVRVSDSGGWTDTWFSKQGYVTNLAVWSRYFGREAPFLGVDALLREGKARIPGGRISLIAADPSYNITTSIADLIEGNFDRSNLLLASLSLLPLKLVSDRNIEIRIGSPIPPGASMGTSAAVSVVLIKVMAKFLTHNGERRFSDQECAHLAWRAETEVMQGQSGIQDQFSAAYSLGAQFITIPEYPRATLTEIPISTATRSALEAGLITVFVGQHSSSDVHRQVITELEREGGRAQHLDHFRGLAIKAKSALEAGDLKLFGSVLTENTKTQAALHQALVGENHRKVIDIAKRFKPLGYKVNGAGGAGGTATFIYPDREAAVAFHQQAQIEFKEDRFLYFEHRLAS